MASSSAAVIFALLIAPVVALNLRDGSEVGFTVKDKIFVDGKTFAEGSAIANNLMCHEHKGTPNFKVCGCGAKVMAQLVTEWHKY